MGPQTTRWMSCTLDRINRRFFNRSKAGEWSLCETSVLRIREAVHGCCALSAGGCYEQRGNEARDRCLEVVKLLTAFSYEYCLGCFYWTCVYVLSLTGFKKLSRSSFPPFLVFPLWANTAPQLTAKQQDQQHTITTTNRYICLLYTSPSPRD